MPTTLAPSQKAWAKTLRFVPNQSLADLRALPEGTLAQLIDGGLIMSPSPTVLHQHIVSSIGRLLGNFVAERDLGIVLVAPIDVELSESQSFQPDVVFVARERMGILGTQKIGGAPDLVVEVLSPSTGYYDLTAKREVYERAGVVEYWIVDPERRTVEVLALNEGAYRTVAEVSGTGRATSRLLDGFAVESGTLFEVGGQYRRNM
jgi:Uma2 family endonuclease